jgi:hypothetical protein
MTEAEWLVCEDPRALLKHVRGGSDQRRLRFFVCACCRRVWDLLADERSRAAVEVAEAFAAGTASRAELVAARNGANAAYRKMRPQRGPLAFRHICAAHLAQQAVALRVTFDPWENEFLRGAQERKEKTERRARAHLAREIFGNPFRPVTFDPAWRTSTVLALARGISDTRDFSAMPILADALQDAGCEDATILEHCRAENVPHIRGCWVVDLILGKK